MKLRRVEENIRAGFCLQLRAIENNVKRKVLKFVTLRDRFFDSGGELFEGQERVDSLN
jgi:hypothetical protein